MAGTTYHPHGWTTEVRLIVRRVKPTPGSQLALFAKYEYHPFVTGREGSTIGLEADHRSHAEVELVIRDLKEGPWAHMPSGLFGANAAWLAIGAIAHNLARWAARLGGINLAVALLLEPGSIALAEDPTSPGTLDALRSTGASLVAVAMNDDGLDIAQLEARVRRFHPRLLCLTPAFHSPTGVVISAHQRLALGELAEDYQTTIVEDLGPRGSTSTQSRSPAARQSGQHCRAADRELPGEVSLCGQTRTRKEVTPSQCSAEAVSQLEVDGPGASRAPGTDSRRRRRDGWSRVAPSQSFPAGPPRSAVSPRRNRVLPVGRIAHFHPVKQVLADPVAQAWPPASRGGT